MNFYLSVQKPALRVINSPSTYPITTYFLGAMGALYITYERWISLSTGFVFLGFLAVLLILAAFRKDIERVHKLVNNRSDTQDARIQQLTDVLTANAVEVPNPPTKESIAQ